MDLGIGVALALLAGAVEERWDLGARRAWGWGEVGDRSHLPAVLGWSHNGNHELAVVRPAGTGYNHAVSAAKTLRLLLGGTSDATIRFDDLCSLLDSLGFEKRVKGSHHLFRKAGVDERINLQRDGGNAKPYQVKQVRTMILKYKLGGV